MRNLRHLSAAGEWKNPGTSSAWHETEGHGRGIQDVSEPCFISAPPYILSSALGTTRIASCQGDALSWRCRSRHLLLALFFPATRHLHNYNLATAVSKTRAPRTDLCSLRTTFHIRFWTCCYEQKKKKSERGKNEDEQRKEEKNELLPLTIASARATSCLIEAKTILAPAKGKWRLS